MKLTERKSFRYGGAAVGLTVAVVAVVIVFNFIVSGIFAVTGQNLDMTADHLFDLSSESEKLLQGREDEEGKVTVYFMADRDRLNMTASSANYYGDSSLWGMKYILELAEEIAEACDYVEVDFIDPTSEPGKIKEIVGDEYYDSHTFGNNSILIDNYTPERDSQGNILTGADGKPLSYWHNFRLYTRDSFYGFNLSTYSAISFKGEYRLVSSILAVTQTVAPTAYFVTGHGEPVGKYELGEEDTGDYGEAGYLWNLLRDSGYTIRKIDLQYEELDATGNALVVLFGPRTDFTVSDGADGEGEIGKLRKFTQTPGHSLLVLLNPTDGARSLPNLEGYLSSAGGIDFVDAKLKDDGNASVTVDGYSLIGQRTEGKDLLSQKLQAVSADERVIFRMTRPLRITDAQKASAVFTVPASSFADVSDAEAVRSDDALLTFSTLSEGSYLVAAGTTMLPYVSYTERAEYANREVVTAALGILSDNNNAYAITDKVIPNEGLNLTTDQATLWTVILSAALPSVIALIGLAVNVRRRFS